MAKQDRSAFRAGLFIVITFLMIGAIVIAIKGVRVVFARVVERKVRFVLTNDIGGLRVGDDVRIGGFKVGAIKQIALDITNGGAPTTIISFSIPEKYELRRDAHIGVQLGLTGTANLNIDNLGTGDTLADNQELTGAADSFATLKSALAKAGPALSDLVQDLKPRAEVVLNKASDALDKGGTAFDSISGLFGDTKTDFRGTIAHLNTITASAQDKLPAILDHVDQAITRITATVDNAKGTLEDLKATMANAKDLTASARGVVVGNRGKFDNIIASLKNTADNLKGASAEVRRSPWRLLYKPAPGEVENLTLFDAARHFADGANSINDASIALRDALQDPKTDREQLQKLMEQLDTSFSNFNEVEKKLWTAVKE